jgi:hypothetical protein
MSLPDSNFQYKTTDLNDIIGIASITANVANGQYIKDANTNSQLSQYYNTLTNSSGPSTGNIAKLKSAVSYETGLIDISNKVIAAHDDYVGGQGGLLFPPLWANACSIILIGGGGSGAGGTQGFNPSPGQQKNAQQGNCGGGGGSGAIVCLQNIPNPQSISLSVGVGGPGTGLDTTGTSGGVTSLQMFSGSTVISCNAGGGGYGNLGQGSDTQPGNGGIPGNPQFITAPQNPAIQHIDIPGVAGQNGSSPGPSNASQFTYCNGGSIDSFYYGNVLPIQIISNGGGNQNQSTIGSQYGVNPFPGSTGYGAGGYGGAGGTQGGPGPVGSTGGAGAQGFARIYWLKS